MTDDSFTSFEKLLAQLSLEKRVLEEKQKLFEDALMPYEQFNQNLVAYDSNVRLCDHEQKIATRLWNNFWNDFFNGEDQNKNIEILSNTLRNVAQLKKDAQKLVNDRDKLLLNIHETAIIKICQAKQQIEQQKEIVAKTTVQVIESATSCKTTCAHNVANCKDTLQYANDVWLRRNINAWIEDGQEKIAKLEQVLQTLSQTTATANTEKTQ